MLASIPLDVARSIGKPEVESYPFHSFHRSSASVGATPTYRFLWMEIRKHGPGIHKHKPDDVYDMATLLNNDESTPSGEWGLLQSIREEPVIIDSKDSSVRQEIMKAQHSF